MTKQAPAGNATGINPVTTVTATFSEPVQPATISFDLKDASGNAVAASVSYNSGTNTVTLTPNAALAPSTTYTATLSGAQDLAGNTMSPITWSFATSSPDTTPPTVTSQTPAANATGINPVTTVTATFSEPRALTGDHLVHPQGRLGQRRRCQCQLQQWHQHGDADSQRGADRARRTPPRSAAQDLAGNTMAPVSWSFTTASQAASVNLFGNATPTNASANDPSAVELGVKFEIEPGRLHHWHPLLQGQRQHGDARWRTCGPHRGRCWQRRRSRRRQAPAGSR